MRAGGRLEAALIAGALGSLIAAQSRINGELTHHVGTGLFPAWLTMTTGSVLLLVIVLPRRAGRAGLRTVAAQARARVLPWWAFTGGVFGSLFLVSQSISVPVVGVAVFTVAVVAGQASGSLIADRLGLTGTGRRAVTARRVVAAVLAVVAVGIGVSDRLSTASGVGALAVLAFIAGMLLAPQQAFNGRVGMAAKDPFVGALGNFLGGVVVMSLVLGGAMLVSLKLDSPGTAPWWSYLGGLLGFAVIAGGAYTVPILGVLVYSLLSVFGQLAGAVILDLVVPTPGTSVGWHLFAGVGVTFLAILVATAPGLRRTQTRV